MGPTTYIQDLRPPATRGPVLVVDDDIGQRLDCRELLEEAGFSVAEAGDGRKALRRLADESEPVPALILVDLSMPFMDGWDFIATLQSQKRLRGIPVVLISAYEADEQLQSSVAAYLKKPVDTEQLMATVSALVERSQQRAAEEPPGTTGPSAPGM